MHVKLIDRVIFTLNAFASLRRAGELTVLISVHGLPSRGAALHLNISDRIKRLLLFVELLHVLEIFHLVDKSFIFGRLLFTGFLESTLGPVLSELLPHVILVDVRGGLADAESLFAHFLLRHLVFVSNFELAN